jgi:hypothetical protein
MGGDIPYVKDVRAATRGISARPTGPAPDLRAG